MIGFIVAAAIFVGVAVLLRRIGGQESPTFVVVQPANSTAVVLNKANTEDESGQVQNDGGDIVGLIHTAPGKRLNRSSHDPMDWKLEKGRERRGILFFIGIQFIWFFRYLRLSDIRTFRWGRKDDQTVYGMMAKNLHTRFPHFSGQHDMQIEHVETSKALRVDLRLNLLYEETYPVRVRYRTADPYAVMTEMVRRIVISILGGTDPKKLINDKNLQKKLADRIMAISANDVEERLGITITKVTLADIDFDEATRLLIEKEARAEIDAEAALITAKNEAAQAIARADGEMQARMKINSADADRLKRVTIPAAETPDRTAVFIADRRAAAYERNAHVTTYVEGGATPVVPVGKK